MKNLLKFTSDPAVIRKAAITLSLISLWGIVYIIACIAFYTISTVAFICEEHGFEDVQISLRGLTILSNIVESLIICGILAPIIGECVARWRMRKRKEDSDKKEVV